MLSNFDFTTLTDAADSRRAATGRAIRPAAVVAKGVAIGLWLAAICILPQLA